MHKQKKAERRHKRTAANHAAALERAVVAFVAHAHQRRRAHVRVTDDALAWENGRKKCKIHRPKHFEKIKRLEDKQQKLREMAVNVHARAAKTQKATQNKTVTPKRCTSQNKIPEKTPYRRISRRDARSQCLAACDT